MCWLENRSRWTIYINYDSWKLLYYMTKRINSNTRHFWFVSYSSTFCASKHTYGASGSMYNHLYQNFQHVQTTYTWYHCMKCQTYKVASLIGKLKAVTMDLSSLWTFSGHDKLLIWQKVLCGHGWVMVLRIGHDASSCSSMLQQKKHPSMYYLISTCVDKA